MLRLVMVIRMKIMLVGWAEQGVPRKWSRMSRDTQSRRVPSVSSLMLLAVIMLMKYKDDIITLSELVCLMFNVHTFTKLLIAICTTSVDSTWNHQLPCDLCSTGNKCCGCVDLTDRRAHPRSCLCTTLRLMIAKIIQPILLQFLVGGLNMLYPGWG